MPGGKLVCTQILGGIKQHTKLDGPVAVGAGVGSAALGVGGGKGGQHLALKFGAQVGHMQGNPQSSTGFGQPSRGRAWAIGQKKTVQGQYAVARIAQHNQRAQAVYTAADGHGYRDNGGIVCAHG